MYDSCCSVLSNWQMCASVSTLNYYTKRKRPKESTPQTYMRGIHGGYASIPPTLGTDSKVIFLKFGDATFSSTKITFLLIL